MIWKVRNGVIARDSRENAIFAASLAERDIAQSESIKALSILKGLQLCTYQGFSNAILESDYLLVVDEILKLEPSNSIF